MAPRRRRIRGRSGTSLPSASTSGKPASSNDGRIATLRVTIGDGRPRAIDFRDDVTGKLVHRIDGVPPGWTPEASLSWIRGWGLDHEVLIVSRDGRITTEAPPWPRGQQASEMPVTAFKDSYFATSFTIADEGYVASALHLWQSDDGHAWRDIEGPALPEATFDYAEVTSGPEELLLRVNGSTTQTVWASADGIEWTRAMDDPDLIAPPEPTEFGWLMPGYRTAAVSGAGLSWERLDLPPLTGEPSLTSANGLLMFGPDQEGDRYVTWVGTLER